MKKFTIFAFSVAAFLSVLLVTRFVVASEVNSGFQVANYESAHKNSIVELSMQDPEMFFPGYRSVPVAQRSLVNLQGKQSMEVSCDEPLKYKKVVLNDENQVAGFIVYFKAKEQSVESVKALMAQHGQILTDEQILVQNPTLKLTDAECDYFILLESIVVDKNHRGKGLSKLLVQAMFEDCAQRWPNVKTFKLNVNDYNSIAINLYEKLGFVLADVQLLQFMHVLQYEKQV